MTQADASAFLERVLPLEGRQATLAFVAGTIDFAGRLDSSNLRAWPVDKHQSFRVVGGNMSLVRSGWKGRFYVQIDSRGHHAVIDRLEAQGWIDHHEPLGQLPSALGVSIPYTELSEWGPRFRGAHEDYIRVAMDTQTSSHHAHHQPALLEVLRAH